MLSRNVPVTGAAVVQFRAEMQASLALVIPGARVTAFNPSYKIPVVDFP